MGTSPSQRLGREGAAVAVPSRPALGQVGERPKIVCLCGSTRFLEGLTPPQTQSLLSRLVQLHVAKIDLADEIFVVNADGYIGSSTRAEIDYAERQGKPVRYLMPPEGRPVHARSR